MFTKYPKLTLRFNKKLIIVINVKIGKRDNIGIGKGIENPLVKIGKIENYGKFMASLMLHCKLLLHRCL
jgi:hypothetical protein